MDGCRFPLLGGRVNLYEYQAKKIFGDYEIPIPRGLVCTTEGEARDGYIELGRQEVVLKTQVLVGGRGKSGGIGIASSMAECTRIFREFMDTYIKDLPVSKILIEEKIEIKNEYYVGITIDPTAYKPILLMSSRGGMDVETIVRESPSALGEYIVNPHYDIPSHEIIKLMNQLGISKQICLPLIEIIKKIYRIFSIFDATLIEINPLVESRDGRLIAVDARLNIDNNALFKHPELEELKKEFFDNKEIYLKDNGVHFIYIGGNVGLICAGAGMTMATMDLVSAMGGKPACFCDISAGINPQSMELAIKTVSSLEGVKSILLSMFGGITRMDEVADSLIAAWKSMGKIPLPIVIRLEGTNVEEGKRMMNNQGFEIFTSLYDAVKKAVDLGV